MKNSIFFAIVGFVTFGYNTIKSIIFDSYDQLIYGITLLLVYIIISIMFRELEEIKDMIREISK